MQCPTRFQNGLISRPPYINDLPASMKVNISFTDDNTVVVRTPDLSSLQKATSFTFKKLPKWFEANGLLLNCFRTNLLHFQTNQMQRKRADILGSVSKSKVEIRSSASCKYLGIKIQNYLEERPHRSIL